MSCICNNITYMYSAKGDKFMQKQIGKKLIALIIFAVMATIFFVTAPTPQGDLTFKVKMDTDKAISSAKAIGEKNGWQIKNSTEVASFSLDGEAQTYYELQVGNYKKLNSLIEKEEGYIPAIWTVSIIPKDGDNKVSVYYTPSGKLYGFNQNVLDNVKGAALSEENARTIAERDATLNWNFNSDEYKLIDKSNKTQTNGRIDYTFNYERAKKIGEANDRVVLVVTGDKLTKVQHYLNIPESFSRKYQERRSSNDSIASSSMLVFYILIFIVGFFCFSYLSKRKMIQWKKPLAFSILIVVLTVLSSLSTLKQALIGWNTSVLSPWVCYVMIVCGVLLIGIFTALFTYISLSIGEGLSRKAFPKHLQFWRMLSIRNFGSWQFLNRVIIAYVFVVIMLMYETVFYGTMNHFPGWWQPASMVTDPNIQTNWLAWISGFAQALNAGFFEEFAFRAIPISLGVLIGSKYNKRKLGVVIAFVFEILMFSAAHANYPGFPAYARLLELLIVAFGFGLMFYNFGIIPGIIAHFTYDFILMSMMIITTSGKALIYQKVIIVLIVAAPLLLAIYGRIRNKEWINVTEDVYNAANQGELTVENISTQVDPIIEETESKNQDDEIHEPKAMGKKDIIISGVFGILVISIILGLFTIHSAIPPLKTEKNQAEILARQEIEKEGYKLSGNWKVISDVEPSDITDVLFIKTEGKDKYKSLIGNYINPLKWKVRFIKTVGDANERTEEFDVEVIDKNHDINVQHILAKNAKGENLTKFEAQKVLYNAIKSKYNIEETDLKEISASELKLDNRTDWSFTLQDKTTKLKLYIPTITVVVSGDKVLQIDKSLEVPQSKKREMVKKYIGLTMAVVVFLLVFIGFIIAAGVKSIIGWTKKQISKPIFFTMFAILLVLNLLSLILNIPTSEIGFSTDKPYNTQLITALAGGVFGRVVISFLEATIISYTKSFYKKATDNNYFKILISICAPLFISALSIIFTQEPVLSVDSSKFCSLGSYSKLLSEICSICTSFIGSLTLLCAIVIMVKIMKNKYVEIFVAVLLFLPLSITAISDFSAPLMIIMPIITLVTYVLLYKYIFKDNFTFAVLTVGTFNILGNVRGVALNQYPNLNISTVIGVLINIGLVIYTYRMLGKKFSL